MAVEMPARVEPIEAAVEVSYPWDAASNAVDALNDAASTLGSQLDQRAAMIPTLDDWEGGYRTEFNNKKWVLQDSTAPGIKDGLTSLAGSIVSGAEEANQQQRRNNDAV